MHHAQVDLADGGLIVVNQSYAALGERGIDNHFLVQFAAHAFGVGNASSGDAVVDRNMPANAYASFAVQPAFAHSFAAGVLEQRFLPVAHRDGGK